MQRLEKKNYPLFKSMFEEVAWELSSLAVVSGNNPGAIWFDEEFSDAAFMHSPEGWLLAGNQKSKGFCHALREWFENKFIPWGDKAGLKEFDVFFLPRWEAASKIIFQERPLIRYPRRHYVCYFDEWTKILVEAPLGSELRLLDSEFILHNKKFRNMGHIRSWVINNWGSFENFDEKGFAFAVIDDNVVLSWSVADCIFENKCEIGIHTDEKFRRQGLASITVKAMLQYAFNKGYKEVGWHCADDNQGSWRTAEKCGFRMEREYYGYYGLINKSQYKKNHIALS